MKFDKVHARYQGPAHMEFLSGWGYDLEIYEEQAGLVTFRQLGSHNPVQQLPKRDFQRRWRILKDPKPKAFDAESLMGG